MKLFNPGAEIFVPDGIQLEQAMSRTTHMAISAHQDDIEFMAYHGILECFGVSDKWFGGVVVTNGAGSPRDGLYANYTDDEMRAIRKVEQKKAAYVGEYSFQALLDFTSSAVKDPNSRDVVEEIKNLLLISKPDVVYTHNLADKHDTHVATAIRTIQAIRELPDDARPSKVLGCEVWRDLDWLNDDDKVALDVAGHENLSMALMGVFDSQISGGKRYDLATAGRRRAHATYFASHGTDTTTQLNFAMDLTPLIQNHSIDMLDYAQGFIQRFADEVSERVKKLKGA